MNALIEFLQRHRQVGLLLAMTLATWVAAATLVNGFASGASTRNLLFQVVTLAIVAAGQTVVIISGGIDLSIPWMMSVSAILLTFFTHGTER